MRSLLRKPLQQSASKHERVRFPQRIFSHSCHHTHTTSFALISHLHTQRRQLSSLSILRIWSSLAEFPHFVFTSSKQRRPASRSLNPRCLEDRNPGKKRKPHPFTVRFHYRIPSNTEAYSTQSNFSTASIRNATSLYSQKNSTSSHHKL